MKFLGNFIFQKIFLIPSRHPPINSEFESHAPTQPSLAYNRNQIDVPKTS